MFRKWLACTALVALCSFGRVLHNHIYRFPELRYFPAMPVPQHPVTYAGVDLGRHLFYDPILSRDSSVSCASCHIQAYAFSDAPNRFSQVAEKPLRRNTPALFNLAWHSSFFWDGRSPTLEDQAMHPLRDKDEMNLTWTEATTRLRRNSFYLQKFKTVFGDPRIDSERIAIAIAQFERTIISYRSKYDRVTMGQDTFSNDEADGFLLMNDMTKGDCLHCHTTDADALGSTFLFSNNGLDAAQSHNQFTDPGLGKIVGKQTDIGKFKIPSVRNLVFTAPYMHDGRFQTIEEVIDFYSEGLKYSATISPEMEFVHRGGAHLTAAEKKKIVAFLKTMSDPELVTDPAFSNPFITKNVK